MNISTFLYYVSLYAVLKSIIMDDHNFQWMIGSLIVCALAIVAEGWESRNERE